MREKIKMTRGFKIHLAIYSTIILLIPLIIIIIKNRGSLLKLWKSITTLFTKIPNFLKTLYTFISDKILYNIVYYLARPASKSKIGLSTVSIILLILFVSFIISYVRIMIGQTEFRTKILPHFTYNLLKKHPKTGDFMFIALLIYVLFLVYKKIVMRIVQGKDVMSHMPKIIGGGIGIILSVLTYYYLNKNFKDSTFTFHYKKYITTTPNASGESNKHLAWTSKSIRYMTLLNMAIIASPIIYLIMKQMSNIIKDTDFTLKPLYLLLISSPFIIYFGYPYVKDWITKTMSDILKRTILFDKPMYIDDIYEKHGLPYNLGDYKSINQKYSNYEIGDVSTPAVPTYSIGLWVWLDNVKGSNINTFDTVLNYNNKPHILVNQGSGEIKILFDNGNLNSQIPETLYLDNLKSQTWNYVVVNFVNNIVEIFINSNLVAEHKNIIPNMKNIYFDNMVIGNRDSTLKIALKKVSYYPRALSISEVKYNYTLKY